MKNTDLMSSRYRRILRPSRSTDGIVPAAAQAYDSDEVIERTAVIQDSLDRNNYACIPVGVFAINQIQIPDQGVLFGMCKQRSILWTANGLDKDLVVLKDHDTYKENETSHSRWDQPNHCSILNLTVDGNADNQTQGSGIWLCGSDVQLFNVLVQQVKEYGIVWNRGTGSPETPDPLSYGDRGTQPGPARFINCQIVKSGEAGFYILSGSDPVIKDISVQFADKQGLWLKSAACYLTGHINASGNSTTGPGNDNYFGVECTGWIDSPYLQIGACKGGGLKLNSGGSTIENLIMLANCKGDAWSNPASRLGLEAQLYINDADNRIGSLTGWSWPYTDLCHITRFAKNTIIESIHHQGTHETRDSPAEEGTPGDGIICDASGCFIQGRLRNYARGVVLDSTNKDEIDGSRIDMGISNCNKGVVSETSGSIGTGNRITVTSDGAVYTPHSLVERSGASNDITSYETDASLELHLDMNEEAGSGDLAEDQAHHARDGELMSGLTWPNPNTGGINGSGSMLFTGAQDDIIRVKNPTGVATFKYAAGLHIDEATFCFWAKLGEVQTNDPSYILGHTSAIGTDGWAVKWDYANARLKFVTTKSSAMEQTYYDASSEKTDGLYHHYAWIWRRPAIALYVDGVAASLTQENGAHAIPTVPAGDAYLTIGAEKPTSTAVFKGHIDEVRVYSLALNPSVIASLAAE